jgi:hypothetical protein
MGNSNENSCKFDFEFEKTWENPVPMKHYPLPKSCSSCTSIALLCHHGFLAPWGHKGLLKSTTKIRPIHDGIVQI